MGVFGVFGVLGSILGSSWGVGNHTMCAACPYLRFLDPSNRAYLTRMHFNHLS